MKLPMNKMRIDDKREMRANTIAVSISPPFSVPVFGVSRTGRIYSRLAVHLLFTLPVCQNWQFDGERGTHLRFAFDPKLAPEPVNDAVTDRETEARPHAPGLGRKERIEDLGQILLRDSATVVLKAQEDLAVQLPRLEDQPGQ